MSKKNLKLYRLNGGAQYKRTSRAWFALPVVLIACAVLAITIPHFMSLNDAKAPAHAVSSKALAENVKGLDQQKVAAVQAPATKTPDTTTSITTSDQSTSSTPTNTQPSAPSASQPTAKKSTTNCKVLVSNLTKTLTSTTESAKTLLTHNMNMVGLDLLLQNKFIDGYNKNVSDAYNSSVKSAKDAGCVFPAAAPTAMVHKKLL